MAFEVPDLQPTSAAPLPITLQTAVDASVEVFRKRLGFFANDSSISDYRAEIVRLMSMAYVKGRIDGKP
jgi:hypothetical protein